MIYRYPALHTADNNVMHCYQLESTFVRKRHHDEQHNLQSRIELFKQQLIKFVVGQNNGPWYPHYTASTIICDFADDDDDNACLLLESTKWPVHFYHRFAVVFPIRFMLSRWHFMFTIDSLFYYWYQLVLAVHHYLLVVYIQYTSITFMLFTFHADIEPLCSLQFISLNL